MIPGSQQRERNGGDHKDDRAPGGNPGKKRSSASRTKCSLASHTAESGGNISTLPVLQEYNDNQNHAYQNVNRSEENNHAVSAKILSKSYGAEGGI